MIEPVLTSVAEQFLDLRIDQNNLPLSIYHHHRIGSGFQQPAELRLSSVPLGAIPNSTRHHLSFFRLQRTETDLYRKFVPILVQAVQFQACPLRSHQRLHEKTRAVFLFFTETATPEIYPLSLHDALPISVAEQFLDLRIDQNNLPLPIYHHHGIGGGFQ